MIDFKSKLDKNSDITAEVFEKFHLFLEENLFNELPEGMSVELVFAYTTLSYLNVRYIASHPENQSVLSLIILGSKTFANEDIYTDHLRAQYAVVNGDRDDVLSGVRVFEGFLEPFKNTLNQLVMPIYCEEYP